MVQPKPMVQTGSALPSSPFAPQPVYIEGVGGGDAGPDGLSWYDDPEDPTLGYSLTTDRAEAINEDGMAQINPGVGLYVNAASGESLEVTTNGVYYGPSGGGPTVELTYPDASGVIATRAWVQAQIDAATST